MAPDIDLFPILRQYSYLSPLNAIQIPRDISRQKLQNFLVANILNNSLLATYPPPPQYQRSFWKKVITHLEDRYDEDEDFELSFDIYDRYLELLQDSQPMQTSDPVFSSRGPPSKSFVTYHWKAPEPFGHTPNASWITTTLLESRNMIENGTTGLRTWTASFHLAQYFLDNPGLILEKRILEFGSGIGFTGTIISSLVIFHGEKDTLPKLWLTDVDETVLAICRDNIELPCNLSSSHGKVATARLNWFDALDEGIAPRLRTFLCEEANPDLVVGSDIVFDPCLIEPLLSTLKIAIGGSEKIALFAVTVRNESTMSRFLSTARDLGLHYEELVSASASAESILPSKTVGDTDTVKLLRFSAKQ